MSGILGRLVGRRRRPSLGRRESLSACPWRAPVVRTVDRPDGGAIVTVQAPCGRVQRLLTGAATHERTYGLDRYGREVLEACDGRRTVRNIVDRFAAAHKVSLAEAQKAVAAFLRTLVSKGLIVMEVRRPRRGRA